jgi:hypothetical protein
MVCLGLANLFVIRCLAGGLRKDRHLDPLNCYLGDSATHKPSAPARLPIVQALAHPACVHRLLAGAMAYL